MMLPFHRVSFNSARRHTPIGCETLSHDRANMKMCEIRAPADVRRERQNCLSSRVINSARLEYQIGPAAEQRI